MSCTVLVEALLVDLRACCLKASHLLGKLSSVQTLSQFQHLRAMHWRSIPLTRYATGGHGRETMMLPVEKKDAPPRKFADVAQTSWFISEGNGGESRKSFHGYPAGKSAHIASGCQCCTSLHSADASSFPAACALSPLSLSLCLSLLAC